MKNKFTSNLTLSHKEIKGKRAEILAKKAEAAMKRKVNTLEEEFNELKAEKYEEEIALIRVN